MSRGPIRRSQMIAPFGVGSTVVLPDGTSVISCGLDHWFHREDSGPDDSLVDIDEFIVREWRLEQLLGVSHFRLPPDYRRSVPGRPLPNTYLTVPFLRFPRWHQCPRRKCGRLEESTLFRRGAIKCTRCAANGRSVTMTQVRFIAVCDHGHIQDFPWLEWVHRKHESTCKGPLRLISSGAISIAGHKIRCEGCDVGDRSMSGSVYAEPGGNTTNLTKRLSKEGPFTCRGMSPWLGDEEGSRCSRPLHVTLRAASNVYFARVKSAIYLPRGGIPAELQDLLKSSVVSYYIDAVTDLGAEVTPEMLVSKFPETLSKYSQGELLTGLRLRKEDADRSRAERPEAGSGVTEAEFRRQELVELTRDRSDSDLVIQSEKMDKYDSLIRWGIEEIKLVVRLRETRALCGFTRVFHETDQSSSELRNQLRRRQLSYPSSWLPAYVVHGEGILLRFSEDAIREWENRTTVRSRIDWLSHHFAEVSARRHQEPQEISPRLVMLHTLAHTIMNRLTFDCGYGTAALRERLYVSNDREEPMASILIYTAAGDSEGTLGGLVRMGRPGRIERVLDGAIQAVRWCSADPVCMEVGESGGQGPDSCNLAACHNCSLVPETACELFNRFLDRALLIGTPQDPAVGFLRPNSEEVGSV